MKGWLDNYNDSKVSAPEGFEGEGYSNVGRNYSPAWGGQFQIGGDVYPVNYVPQAQMGGTIAGAPGFSYARTQGAAPSNGKYAKKTLPSAQDGIRSNKLIPPPKNINKPKDVRKKGDVMKLQSMYNTDEVNYVPTVESLKGLKNPNLSSIESAATDQFVDWYSNPETLKRTKTAGYDPARIKDFIAKGLKTPIKVNSRSSDFPMNPSGEGEYRSPYVSKQMDDPTHPDTGYIMYNPQATDIETKSVIGHELPHASGLDNLYAPSLYRALDLKLPEKYHSALQYMDKPEEVYGNFQEMRLQMGLKPGQKINYKTLYDKMKDDKIPNNFWRNFSADPKTGKPDPNRINKIVKAINTVASVDNTQQDPNIQTAQNGKEMSYYQNGLDFKPKSISKNGSWLSKYDVAQDGDILDKFRESHPSVRSIQNDAMNRKIQQSKGRGKETVVTKKDNTRTVTPKEIKKLSGRQQNELAQSQSEEQARKDWVQGSMEEAYKSPLMSPGYFTPEGVAVGALQGATKLGPDLYEGNYKGAAIDALMALPIGIPAAKKLLPRFTPKQNYTLPEIESELNLNVNQSRINQVRSTPKVKKKLLPQWTETQLDNGLIEQTPLRKGINQEVVKKVAVPGKGEIALKTSVDASGNPVYYFSADVPEGGLSAGKAYKHLEQFIPKGSKILEKKSLSTDSFYNIMQRAKNPKKFTWVNEEQFVPLNNAGKNKLFSNSDKIVPGSTNVKFENFNEAQKALNEFNSRITIEGMPKAKLSKIVDDFQPVENGPWIKKTTFGIDAPNIGLIKEYKQGGIIKDDRGQWDHPGEITEIGSNEITMEGVPYDVLGISDTGDTKLMKPGKNYKFKGKKVTEYPMAKDGLRQEQKSLQNLDNLTNFTNYNKPQPGGWLNKYN